MGVKAPIAAGSRAWTARAQNKLLCRSAPNRQSVEMVVTIVRLLNHAIRRASRPHRKNEKVFLHSQRRFLYQFQQHATCARRMHKDIKMTARANFDFIGDQPRTGCFQLFHRL